MLDEKRPNPDADQNRDFATGQVLNESRSGNDDNSINFEEMFSDLPQTAESNAHNAESGKNLEQLKSSVEKLIPLDVDDEEEGHIDERGHIIRRAPASRENHSQPERRTLKVEAPPQYPGRPYKDEMVGNLWLGPRLREIETQLAQKDIDEVTKINLSNEKARLYTAANAANQWVYGPVNERKMITREFLATPVNQNEPEPIPDEVPVNNDLKHYDEDRMPNPVVEPTQEPEEEKGNRLTKWVKKVARNITKDMKGFDEYLTRSRDEMHNLAAYAGIAGIVSVTAAAAAAEVALALAAPPLLIPIAAVAAGGLINYFGFTKEVSKWANEKYDKTVASRNPEDTQEYRDFIEKAKLDKKYRMRTFVWADIVAKVAGGIGLGHILASGPQHDGSNLGGAHDGQVDKLGTSAHANAHFGAEPTPGIESLHPNFVEHVVSSNDEMLTKILEQNLPAGEHIYSENYIELLQDNRDTFVNMLKQMYPNGGVPYVVDANNTIKLPLDQAIANIDKVIARGYPDENTMSPELYRQALTDMFNAIRHLKVGTVIKIRQ